MKWIWFVLLIPSVLAGGPRSEIVFAGVMEGGAPSFERSLERLIREQLAMYPGVTLRDDRESVRFRRGVGLSSASVITRSMLESIRKYALDSAFFVYGSVEGYTIEGRRRGLGSEIAGEVTIALAVYNYRTGAHSFLGAIRCTDHLRKDFPALYSVDRMHIGAPQRALMQDRLAHLAAQRAVSTITAVIGRTRPERVKIKEILVSPPKSSPSISEIFDFPTAGTRTKARSAVDTVKVPVPDQTSAGAVAVESSEQPVVPDTGDSNGLITTPPSDTVTQTSAPQQSKESP